MVRGLLATTVYINMLSVRKSISPGKIEHIFSSFDALSLLQSLWICVYEDSITNT